MRYIPFFLLSSLLGTLSGCSTEPVRPDVLALLTASVLNASGQPLSG